MDIAPSVTVIRTSPSIRRMADTERGDELRGRIAMLERLIEAYRNNDIRQQ